jgi:hypothetical protein
VTTAATPEVEQPVAGLDPQPLEVDRQHAASRAGRARAAVARMSSSSA